VGTGPPTLFLTLGRHHPLFSGWLRFARRLIPGGVLPRRETELVLLRVAHLCACR
jgi:alkylhydroperoxidase family enzyme